MKKAIVTGASGFVGSAVVRELLSRQVEVYAIVRPNCRADNGALRLSGLDVKFVECDLTDIRNLPKIIRQRDFDIWYQFAWDGLKGSSFTDYTVQIMNIKWTADSVIAAAELGCEKFVGAGTISQYDLRTWEGQTAVSERHKVFKVAKQSSEYIGRSLAAEHNIKFIWPIITNIYGAGEDSPRLINSMIRKLLAGERQQLSEGSQFYDFIYITDAARALYLIGEKGSEKRVYTVAQGAVQPLKQFLIQIRDIVSPGVELGFGELPFRSICLPKECYDISALAEDTGFEASVTFEDGIRETARWIRSHMDQ